MTRLFQFESRVRQSAIHIVCALAVLSIMSFPGGTWTLETVHSAEENDFIIKAVEGSLIEMIKELKLEAPADVKLVIEMLQRKHEGKLRLLSITGFHGGASMPSKESRSKSFDGRFEVRWTRIRDNRVQTPVAMAVFVVEEDGRFKGEEVYLHASNDGTWTIVGSKDK